MIVAVQGTKNFNDYNIFLRAMGTAMSQMLPSDKSIIVYSAGPVQINQMVMEFCNVSERGLKARGIKIKYLKFPQAIIEDKLSEVDYVVFLSKPKEPVSSLVDLAEAKDIEVGIYRY